jgi:serine/threonine protein kinase
MAWQFLVVDGADARRVFPLPEEGTLTIGGGFQNHADVCLHDLYVARLHCQVETSGEKVVVRRLDADRPVLVNRVAVQEQELHLGDVLRVGNSHLRLEPFDSTAAPAKPAPASHEESAAPPGPAEPRSLPHLPLERLEKLSGHTLSHYEIKEVLGRGRFGVVFAAHDLKNDQAVALKVLSPEFPKGSAEMQVFAAAIRSAMALRHAYLIRVHNAGKTGPYCWLALEHVEGKSVAQTLTQSDASTKNPWKSALRIAVHVGRALQFLHPQRIVHGNITPANVLVRQSDKVAKLGDLMLNRALEGSALQQARLEAKLLAELGYLSPEQAAPDAFTDHLSDIYALGAVVYARLTGRPPFQADTPEETLQQIAETVPPRPKQFHRIPAPLDAAVMRMLARRQEDRYQTAAELVAELEALAAAEGVEV